MDKEVINNFIKYLETHSEVTLEQAVAVVRGDIGEAFKFFSDLYETGHLIEEKKGVFSVHLDKEDFQELRLKNKCWVKDCSVKELERFAKLVKLQHLSLMAIAGKARGLSPVDVQNKFEALTSREVVRACKDLIAMGLCVAVDGLLYCTLSDKNFAQLVKGASKNLDIEIPERLLQAYISNNAAEIIFGENEDSSDSYFETDLEDEDSFDDSCATDTKETAGDWLEELLESGKSFTLPDFKDESLDNDTVKLVARNGFSQKVDYTKGDTPLDLVRRLVTKNTLSAVTNYCDSADTAVELLMLADKVKKVGGEFIFINGNKREKIDWTQSLYPMEDKFTTLKQAGKEVEFEIFLRLAN